MSQSRAALYVDFDNVFNAFLRLDPSLGMAFAQRPGDWLRRLSAHGGDRRWLLRRCYMNPAGWVSDPRRDEGDRLSFHRFRSGFTQAGFEVIDCPPLTSRYKTATDMHIVVDAMDALTGPAHVDEFVIVSGDADFTPLLMRLRADDRRIAVLAPSNAAEAFRATADLVVSGEDALALLERSSEGEAATPRQAATGEEEAGSDVTTSLDEDPQSFGAFLRARYAEASAPLNLATLAAETRAALGDETVRTTNWFGAGSFTNAVRILRLPDASISVHHLWDSRRHADPTTASGDDDPTTQDGPARLVASAGAPNLRKEIWPLIYEILAEYAATQEYSLTQASRWARDRLDEQNVHVGRAALSFIVGRLASGAAPLHRRPAPAAEEIGHAFVQALLTTGLGAQLTFTDDEVEQIALFLGLPDAEGLDAAS